MEWFTPIHAGALVSGSQLAAAWRRGEVSPAKRAWRASGWRLPLRLEYIAQEALEAALAPEKAAQSLPLPRGASVYLGWFEHADFGGCMRLRLSIARSGAGWAGAWEFGGHPGPRELVRLDLELDRSVSIWNVTGRHCTELRGKANASGILSGEVEQDGVGGGRFMLWPQECGTIARHLQEWYVALRSGPCLQVLPHEKDRALPPECPICLDEFLPGDVIVRTSCSVEGHIFHRGCANDWLRSRSSCPLCRRVLLAAPLCVAAQPQAMSADAYEVASFLSYEMWRAQHP